MEIAPPSSPRKNKREPGVHIPEWLDDPFKEDQSRREEKLRQRLLASENRLNDIRLSQQPQSRPVALAEQSKQKVEPASREPAIRLNIAAQSGAAQSGAAQSGAAQSGAAQSGAAQDVGRENAVTAAGTVSQRSDSSVIKASANQPIRITFPAKK